MKLKRSFFITVSVFLSICLSCCSKQEADYADMVKDVSSAVLNNMFREGADSSDPDDKIFTLGHCSDIHAESLNWDINLQEFFDFFHSPELKPYTDAIICTGDICNGFPCRDKNITLSEISRVSNHFLNLDIPSFFLIGNHDTNIEEAGSANIDDIYKSALTKEEQYRYIIKPLAEKWGYAHTGKSYYKKVFDKYKIVLIALDFVDYPILESRDGLSKLWYKCGYIFSGEQLKWLYHALCEIPKDYGLIMAVHSLPHTKLQVGIYDQGISLLTEIVHAYMNGTLYSHEWKNPKYGALKTKQDFDFTGYGKKEFICWLGGHIHSRAVTTSDIYPDQLMISAPALFTEKSRYPGLPFLERHSGDDTRNSFNIIQIDRKDRKIFLTCFGAYQDENIRSRSLTLSY